MAYAAITVKVALMSLLVHTKNLIFLKLKYDIFSEKAQKATFKCIGYEGAFGLANDGDVIYCDPPYAPLSTTASFTTYAGPGFSLDDQALLARHSRHTAHKRNIPVLISNHDIPLTRELYRGAKLATIAVQRNISQKGSSRNKVDEIMALYDHHYFDEVY